MVPKPDLIATADACLWVKRRVCERLDITRPTLDLWIARYEIDWNAHRESKDSRATREGKYSASGKGGRDAKHATRHGKAISIDGSTVEAATPTFPVVSSHAASAEVRVPASIRVRETVWKRLRIEAIRRGVHANTLAEQAFEEFLARGEATQENGTRQ